jgi:transcriptional regulator with XRE-family HTH domain
LKQVPIRGDAVVLLRKVIGDVLRARRLAQHRTLREVSTAANVSLGYLSEIERGHKEASSELLASICDALGTGLSDVLGDVSATFALAEQMETVLSDAREQTVGAGERSAAEPSRAMASASAGTDTTLGEDRAVAVSASLRGEPGTVVTDGEVTVSVRSDGPLRTTLTARRASGPRHPESVFVG